MGAHACLFLPANGNFLATHRGESEAGLTLVFSKPDSLYLAWLCRRHALCLSLDEASKYELADKPHTGGNDCPFIRDGDTHPVFASWSQRNNEVSAICMSGRCTAFHFCGRGRHSKCPVAANYMEHYFVADCPFDIQKITGRDGKLGRAKQL